MTSRGSPAKEPVLEELRVHRNWITLISFCKDTFQHGRLAFKLIGAVPIELNDKLTHLKKRFDVTPQPLALDFSEKEDEGEPDIIVMKVTRSWVNLIQFCRDSIPYGQMCVEIVNSEPRDMDEKHTFAKVRFDRPQTIPGIFANFQSIQD